MAGLEISGTQSGTSTRGTTGGQPKSQQNQNIVIEFSSLPDKLKTKEVRAFYDKDESGFIESQNANGQNEYALMTDFAKSMGIDLSKYKSDIVNVKGHIGFGANGKAIREIENIDGKYIRIRTYSSSAESYTNVDTNTYKEIGETRTWNNLKNGRVDKTGTTPLANGMTYKLHENYGPNGTKGETNDTIYDKNGTMLATHQNKYIRRDLDGEENYVDLSEENKMYQNKSLTSGQNKLVLHSTYKLNMWVGRQGTYANPTSTLQANKGSHLESHYTLNGKPVQAKPIGKGRYEVTDKDGNVFYISHDGVNLKPEYVRNNP